MIPKHLMESKLITDEQWEEYMQQKAYIRQLETEQLRDKQTYQMQIDLLQQENEKLKLNHKQLSDIEKMAICNSRLIQENKQLKKQVIIMEKYLELIYDLGFDYDGCNTVSSLKGVIDAMCDWASWGRACNITKPIFESEGKAYNILHEEIDNEN